MNLKPGIKKYEQGHLGIGGSVQAMEIKGGLKSNFGSAEETANPTSGHAASLFLKLRWRRTKRPRNWS
jgi:hypothetical protein